MRWFIFAAIALNFLVLGCAAGGAPEVAAATRPATAPARVSIPGLAMASNAGVEVVIIVDPEPPATGPITALVFVRNEGLADVLFGYTPKPWFGFVIRDPEGQVIAEPRKPDPDIIRGIMMPAGECISARFDLRERFRFDRPGKYTMTWEHQFRLKSNDRDLTLKTPPMEIHLAAPATGAGR